MKTNVMIVVCLLVASLLDVVVTTGTLEQLSVRTQIHEAVGHPRSEIDLETEKSVVICAGQNKSLECFSPGSTIAIQEAFWGRLSSSICPSEDGDPVTNCYSDATTTPIVRNLCDDKEYCEIPASHNVLQPPGVKHCPGINKYLAVKYSCMPEKHKFVLCNGETTELTCGQGWKIHVISAYWGRDSPSTCPTPLGKFFTCANSGDSILALKSRCSGEASCIVTADDHHYIIIITQVHLRYNTKGVRLHDTSKYISKFGMIMMMLMVIIICAHNKHVEITWCFSLNYL
ncbi:PREDICTED: L-rhamnose-binding lectin CSL1-like [Acropora digitifera]|uniref:L-rhamnose-binding lectin CSL1-like n=1 Tax=Acropora digitifera TaxID=70779 RepID=UPI00077B0171|nr:PREDICTED: L-rhamnose-binding lectin CSL1-like [Acropora digitifera]